MTCSADAPVGHAPRMAAATWDPCEGSQQPLAATAAPATAAEASAEAAAAPAGAGYAADDSSPATAAAAQSALPLQSPSAPATSASALADGLSDGSWVIDPAADLVLSEVHVGAAPSHALQCTTTFPIRSQREGSAQHVIDEDGDVIVPRRRKQDNGADCGCASDSCGECAHPAAGHAPHGIIIQHALATSLNDVGKQVWRGSLLLADWAFATGVSLQGRTVVELGTGTGIAGIAAAAAADAVLLTDLPSALPLCQVNVNNNRQRLRGGAAAPSAAHLAAGHSAGAEYGAQCHVLPLDWGDMPPLRGAACLKDATSSTDATHACGVWAEAHGWTMEQLCLLQHSEVLLAADCVYDNDLTDAFMAAAATLLQPCVCAGADAGCGAWSTATGSSPSGGSKAYGCRGSSGVGANVGGRGENVSIGDRGVSGANSTSTGSRSCVGPSSSASASASASANVSKGSGKVGRSSGGSVTACGGPIRCLYVALEKRWNFMLRNLESRAAAFDYWCGLFTEVPTAAGGAESVLAAGPVESAAPLSCQAAKTPPGLAGRRLTVDALPQMLEYDRGCDLELWQLWAA